MYSEVLGDEYTESPGVCKMCPFFWFFAYISIMVGTSKNVIIYKIKTDKIWLKIVPTESSLSLTVFNL